MADKGNNYKNTMNLPQTDFPMRGEPARQRAEAPGEMGAGASVRAACWRRTRTASRSSCMTALRTPTAPSTSATPSTRSSRTSSYKSHAQRGFYHALHPRLGLPRPADRAQGRRRRSAPEKMRRDRPVRRCASSAANGPRSYVDVQREGFKRLGVNGDWEHPYLTFHARRTRRPTSRCSRSCTSTARSIAAASPSTGASTATPRSPRPRSSTPTRRRPSIYVQLQARFQVPEAFAQPGVELDDAYVLIWTTTPWTLPANVGRVPSAPDADYVHRQGRRGLSAVSPHELVEARRRGVQAGRPTSVVCEGRRAGAREGRRARRRSPTSCPILTGPDAARIVCGDHVTLDYRHGRGAHRSRPRRRGLPDGPRVRPRRCSCPSTTTAASRTSRAAFRGHGHRRGEPASSSIGCASSGTLVAAQGRSRTATRIAGAATSPSSSARPTSGSSRWRRPACARTRSTQHRQPRAPGIPHGRQPHRRPWSPTVPTGASRASATGACRSRCSSAPSAARSSPPKRRSTR